MSTLLISDVFPPKNGGSGRWFWEIYRRLPRKDYVIAAGENFHQEEFDQTHDLQLERLPLTLPSWGICNLGGLRGYWRAIRRLGKLAAAKKVTKVHCGRCLPEGLMGLALKWRLGLPYLCYVHGEEMQYALHSKELRWLTRRVLGGATLVIANSRNTARIIEKQWHLSKARIQLLHPGVDTNHFLPAPRDQIVRQVLGWEKRRVLLTVGRLQKRKGHDQMIAALPKIRQTIPDVLYAIVGDGEEMPQLRKLAEKNGVTDSVQFLGELKDDLLVSCYQQSDLFVLPNRQVGQDIEGFGMVLLEAQACGKPVIAGASGGTAETMQIPETGRIVNCDNPDHLQVLVSEMLSNPELLSQMGQAGRRWVISHFDWTALSKQAEELFRFISPDSRAVA